MSLTWRADPAAEWIVTRSRWDLRRLVAEIEQKSRDYPALALAGEEDYDPRWLATQIREAVDPRIDIYLVVNDRLFRRVARLGGTRLTLDGREGRIWWPEVRPASGARDSQAADRVGRAIDASRPGACIEIERLTLENSTLRVVSNRDQLEIRALEMAFWSALQETVARAATLELVEALLPSVWACGSAPSSPAGSHTARTDRAN